MLDVWLAYRRQFVGHTLTDHNPPRPANNTNLKRSRCGVWAGTQVSAGVVERLFPRDALRQHERKQGEQRWAGRSARVVAANHRRLHLLRSHVARHGQPRRDARRRQPAAGRRRHCYCFASAAVAVDSSHMSASSSACRVDSVHFQTLLMGTCRQCGSWSDYLSTYRTCHTNASLLSHKLLTIVQSLTFERNDMI